MDAMESLAVSPLARKLRLKPGARAAVVGAPPDYRARLSPRLEPTLGTSLIGPLDWLQVFVESSAELAAIVPDLIAALDPNGIVWIAYPKGSSRRQTDLTRDKGWESLEGSNLRWLSLVSIDDVWSAFSLRPYKPGEARQTFR
jgi:hypothetical protein